MIKTLLFIGFFTSAGLLIFFSNVDRTDNLLLLVIFVPFIAAGLGGITAWPMFSWHLYPEPLPQEQQYHEFRVVDAQGTELKYDARAAPPAIPTPMNRHAETLATEFDRSERQQAGCFFLQRADSYRGQVGNKSFWRYAEFPPHQFGYEWTPERLDGLGPIVELRIYRVTQTISPDGTEIQSQTESQVYSLNQTTCA